MPARQLYVQAFAFLAPFCDLSGRAVPVIVNGARGQSAAPWLAGKCARAPNWKVSRKMLRLAPKLLKFLALNCAIGVAAGMFFLAGLMTIDLAGLRTLIWASPDPVLPLALLAAGLSVTFGGVAMAGAVMMLPSAEDD